MVQVTGGHGRAESVQLGQFIVEAGPAAPLAASGLTAMPETSRTAKVQDSPRPSHLCFTIQSQRQRRG